MNPVSCTLMVGVVPASPTPQPFGRAEHILAIARLIAPRG